MYEIKIGFIGYSKHAIRIAEYLFQLNKKLNFYFFNYKNKTKIEKLKKYKNFKLTTDFLKIKSCEILVICSPPQTHFKYLIKSGVIHLICGLRMILHLF